MTELSAASGSQNYSSCDINHQSFRIFKNLICVKKDLKCYFSKRSIIITIMGCIKDFETGISLSLFLLLLQMRWWFPLKLFANNADAKTFTLCVLGTSERRLMFYSYILVCDMTSDTTPLQHSRKCWSKSGLVLKSWERQTWQMITVFKL